MKGGGKGMEGASCCFSVTGFVLLSLTMWLLRAC